MEVGEDELVSLEDLEVRAEGGLIPQSLEIRQAVEDDALEVKRMRRRL